MPYLMGGFPTLDASRAIGEAYAEAGADLVELGVPFSDPLADGPVIHAAGTAALAGGRDAARRARGRPRARRGGPGRAHVLRQPRARARRRSASPTSSRERGISGLIVPDLPLEEAGDALAACDAAGVALVAARRADDARRAAGARSARRARGFLYTVSVTGTTGERRALPTSCPTILARTKAHADVPVALGFGIGTPGGGRAGRRRGRRRRDRRLAARARRGRGAGARGGGARPGGRVRRRAP